MDLRNETFLKLMLARRLRWADPLKVLEVERRASFERLLSMGTTVHEKPVERGPGFVTASVVDPFGNILGVMYNQHYLEILGKGA